MPSLDTVLELLRDGKWHRLEDIVKKLELQEDRVKKIAEFLEKYDFIQLDGESKRAKLTTCLQEFLVKTRHKEE